MVYLDYSKAFDSVPHLRLIQKLVRYGIGSSLLLWMRSFLIGRSQRVVLNGIASHWSDVTSRVPQGSVLRSLLFVLYINDITDVNQSDLGIFTDDTKIFSIIRDICNMTKLQRDLNNMQEWSKCW